MHLLIFFNENINALAYNDSFINSFLYQNKAQFDHSGFYCGFFVKRMQCVCVGGGGGGGGMRTHVSFVFVCACAWVACFRACVCLHHQLN